MVVYILYVIFISLSEVSAADHDPPSLISWTYDSFPLCYDINALPQFSYNLVSTPFLSVNAFLNSSSSKYITQVSFIIQSKGIAGLMRKFRGWVDGVKKYVNVENLGEFDLQNSRVELSLQDGQAHVNSEVSHMSVFVLCLQQPLIEVLVMEKGRLVVQLMNTRSLMDISIHGIMGQVIGAHVDTNKKEVKTDSSKRLRLIPMTVQYGNLDEKECWTIPHANSLLEGKVHEYIVDNILETKFIFSQYKQ